MQGPFHSWKLCVMAMLMCCLSFLIYFGGKNASYNGQKNYESLDVQRQCAHICPCNKLSKWFSYLCLYGFIWNSWKHGAFHGQAIVIIT